MTSDPVKEHLRKIEKNRREYQRKLVLFDIFLAVLAIGFVVCTVAVLKLWGIK